MYSYPSDPPIGRCEVYREACVGYSDEDPELVACLERRDECKVTPDLDVNTAPPGCRPSIQVQPCPWARAPSLLGTRLYYFGLDSEDEDFPYECALGLLGSAEPELQTSAKCAGKCPPGSREMSGSLTHETKPSPALDDLPRPAPATQLKHCSNLIQE